jgi:hypothetical protein
MNDKGDTRMIFLDGPVNDVLQFVDTVFYMIILCSGMYPMGLPNKIVEFFNRHGALKFNS